MASKENQEALNVVNNFFEWNSIEGQEVKYPFQYNYDLVSNSIDTLQKSIHDLEIYKKALYFTCSYNVCFDEECNEEKYTNGCKECRKLFALNKARKELENVR